MSANVLALPGGPPSHDTFKHLFQMLDPAVSDETLGRWTESLRAALPAGGREIVALDDEAARRAVNAGKDTRYLVSAYLNSLPVEVTLFARAVRGHWAVENTLHWTLQCGLRRGPEPDAHRLCRG